MSSKQAEDIAEVEDPEDLEDIEDPDDLEDIDEDDLDDDIDDEIDDGLDDDLDDEDLEDPSDDQETPEDHDDETAEALEELESQELKLLDEEADDALLVDEVKELRAIRREELTMDVDAQSLRSDEFVCQSCFMVKRSSQLANKRKKLCADCAY